MADQQQGQENTNMAQDPSRKEPVEGSEDGGGITNRPLDEEEEEQQQVPPRGDSKDGAHA